MDVRKTINHLESLEGHYDAFIFDLWGVVHNGYEPYPGVLAYLEHLWEIGKSVIFLSNAPRPAPVIMQKLLSFGIKVTPEMVLTSGDMVRHQLINFDDNVFKKLGKKFYHLGADRNQDILAGLPVETLNNIVNNLENADFLLLTAYIDMGEDLNQHDDFLKTAASLGLPAVCANPDKEIINGDKLRYCSGFLAEKFLKMGGVVHYYGKPYLSVYQETFRRFEERGINNKNRILMIGDTLETDILGAKNAGIDSALVLNGNISILLANQINTLPSLLETYQVNPKWIIPSFEGTKNAIT